MAVEVTLILMIVGLALGILDDNKTRQVGIGADLTVRPPGSSNLAAFGGAPVPMPRGRYPAQAAARRRRFSGGVAGNFHHEY